MSEIIIYALIFALVIWSTHGTSHKEPGETDRQTDRDRGPGCHDSTDLGVIQSKATVDGECLKRLLVIAIECTRQFVHHLHHPDHTETHLSVTICTTPITLKHIYQWPSARNIYQWPSAPPRSHWNISINDHLHHPDHTETYLSMTICTTPITLKHIYQWPSAPPRSHWNISINDHLHHPDHTETYLSMTICTTPITLKHIYQWPSAPPRSHWNISISDHLHHPDHTETYLSVTICTTPITLKHIYQWPSAPPRSHWNISINDHLDYPEHTETHLSMTICTTPTTLKHPFTCIIRQLISVFHRTSLSVSR